MLDKAENLCYTVFITNRLFTRPASRAIGWRKDFGMSNKSGSSFSGCGLGVAGVLGIVFIVLKLVGVIDWSWWWVLSPFCLGPVIVIGLLAFMFGIASILAWLDSF